MFAIKRFKCPAQFRQFVHFSSETWILLALGLLAVGLRVPGIARPLLGNFATKNVVYAMIARNWITGGSSLWYPALDCVQADGLALHMLEFPVAAYLAGGCWWCLGGSLEGWGRLLAIGFSAATVCVLYLLARRWHSQGAATVAAAAFALAPVSVIYGQAFMLEASLSFFAVCALYAAQRWCDGQQRVALVLFAVALALAALTKIYAVALLLPIGWMAYRALTTGQMALRPAGWLLVVTALALAPAGAWYWHAAQTAAPGSALSDQVFFSVRNSASDHRPPHPLLFEGQFYRRLIADLGSVVLTPLGLTLALLGATRRESRVWWPWLAAGAMLMLLLPRKFFEMNYYYLAVLPPLCLLVGLGWQTLRERYPSRRLAIALALAGCLFSVRYFVRPAFVTPAEDRSVLAAAEAVQRYARHDERIATMHGSTLDLLYYSQRKGWFVAPSDDRLDAQLQHCRASGARLLVVAETSAADHAGLSHLPCIERGEGYAIYALMADAGTSALAAQPSTTR